MRLAALGLFSLLIITACSNPSPQQALIENQANVDYDILLAMPDKPLSFMDDVQPVLDKRCVVCHGCYDAPCQLKLNSFAGIARGANKEKVYNGSRIKPMPKTRLFVDANSTAEWREMDFTPVISEGPEGTPKSNLSNSVMYRMLRLKQLYPQPKTGMLSADVDTALDRAQVCTTLDTFDKFAEEHPEWGMPYGLPNLPDQEYATLVQWLAQGAKPSAQPELSESSKQQVADWEAFLNRKDLKGQLVSRYIYEHLVQGHIYFKGSPDNEFFRLIRSANPPGKPAIEIASERPYSDPGQPFWYRVKRYEPHIVIKDHVPYQWSPAKMQRYTELFYDVEYEVTEAAPYGQELAANPFRVFKELPPDSRYRFMLDDARFYIQGFMKGPVCRGQIALNVIEDHFWVNFVEPDLHSMTQQPEYLNALIDDLELPDNRGNTLNVPAIWTDYWKRQQKYLQARVGLFDEMAGKSTISELEYIWDGDGVNRNAALTIFRHQDSASVSFGHLGDYPETAWIIDFPLLERIHYLLVVGYDVYGNVGHQFNTRLFMDFLRMEGEDMFLSLMRPEQRKAVRDSWYVGVHAKVKKNFDESEEYLKVESGVELTSDDPVAELFQLIHARIGAMAGPGDPINRCSKAPCFAGDANARVEQALQQATKITGRKLLAFPDNSFLRVVTPEGQPDLAYSIIVNKGYKDLTTMFESEDNRSPDDDTLTILPGLVGSYPNFFYVVELDDIENFAARLAGLQNRDDYERFVALYGVRRTNSGFWDQSDWFHATARQQDAIESGIFDLNRYKNR